MSVCNECFKGFIVILNFIIIRFFYDLLIAVTTVLCNYYYCIFCIRYLTIKSLNDFKKNLISVRYNFVEHMLKMMQKKLKTVNVYPNLINNK